MIKYFALRKVTKNLIFIDGINRTGKLLTGSLVSSFKKMEHLEFGEIFQHIIPKLNLVLNGKFMIGRVIIQISLLILVL